MSVGGEALFTLVGHGQLWHSHRERPLLAAEWLSAHAVPLPEYASIIGEGHVFPCDFMSLLYSGRLKIGDIHSLVGNGWHIGSLGSWLMFLLASTELEGLVAAVPRSLSTTPKRRKVSEISTASSPSVASSPLSSFLRDPDSLI